MALTRHPDPARLGHSPYRPVLFLSYLPDIGPNGALDGSLLAHAQCEPSSRSPSGDLVTSPVGSPHT